MRALIAMLPAICCAIACRPLVIAECTVRCNAGQCAPSLSCGSDGYCHGDGQTAICGDGGTADGATPNGCVGCVTGGPYNYVFLTSTTYTPGQPHVAGGKTFASVADADAICAERAQAGQLPGTFVAWISSATLDAVTRLTTPGGQPARGFVRPDGRPFADSITALENGQIFYPPSVDELRQDWRATTDYVLVATGTTPSGTKQSTAIDWGSSTLPFAAGDARESTTNWTQNDSFPASTAVHIYCFAIDRASPLSIDPPAGRAAFVSSKAVSPSIGLAGADAECQSEATTLAGLPAGHHYLALLATSSASAISRFDLTGPPWVRLDGVAWVAQAADLGSGDVIATLNLDPRGNFSSFQRVWTGAIAPGSATAGGQSCSDWSSASSGATANTGLAQFVGFNFFAETQRPCSELNFLYCLQND
jgi:hypothetical protein